MQGERDMSVLIKSMKMPTSCAMCGVRPEAKCFVNYKWLLEHPAFYEERLSDCPLIEIPTPHGALIDMDDFLSEWSELESYRTAMSLCEIIPPEEE